MLNRLRAQKLLGGDWRCGRDRGMETTWEWHKFGGERMGLLKGTHTHTHMCIYIYLLLLKLLLLLLLLWLLSLLLLLFLFFDQPNEVIWVQKNRVYTNEQTSSSILWGVSIQFEFVQKIMFIIKKCQPRGRECQFLSLRIVGFWCCRVFFYQCIKPPSSNEHAVGNPISNSSIFSWMIGLV